VLPIAIGLSAAGCVGVANVLAGVASRRLSSLLVGFWEQATGAVLAVVFLLLLRPPLQAGQIPWGMAAGLLGGIGVALFYRAMAAGAISLVTPISACAVVFPVVYAIASGETVTPLIAAGMVAIISGVVLASMQPAPVPGDPTDTGLKGDRLAVLLAIAAAVVWGTFFIVIDQAPPANGWGALWTAGAVRWTGFGVQVALVALGPRRLATPGASTPAVVGAGVLDLASLILVSFGAMTESYGIVTALLGLYPVVTALIGFAVLGERLTRLQATGATLAIAGVMLVSL
jgi:drug/metabolite transporter (DMT)-like permease